MSKIPDWCAKYVGLPFAEKGRGPNAFDCWGLARHVLHHEFGVTGLPDYVDAYASTRDKASVARAVEAGLAGGWIRVNEPQAGALVILRLAGRPWHCGVSVSNRQMLHVVHSANAVVEPIDSIVWKNRVEGFYLRSNFERRSNLCRIRS